MSRGLFITEKMRQEIIDYWRVGKNCTWIGKQMKITRHTVAKIVQNQPQDLNLLVNGQIEINQFLAALTENQKNLVNDEVKQRSQFIDLFNNMAIRNAVTATAKIGTGTSIGEHRLLADTIRISRETVLGKGPDTAIQVNNNLADQQQNFKTVEEFKVAGQELLDAIG